jgi:hypothetical protein
MKLSKQTVKKLLTKKNLEQYLLSYHPRSIVGTRSDAYDSVIGRYLKRSLELEYHNYKFIVKLTEDELWIDIKVNKYLYVICDYLESPPRWVRKFDYKLDMGGLVGAKVTASKALKVLSLLV